MGMYTGLRFKGVVKHEFSQMIKKMNGESLDWMDLYELYPQYSFLKEFGEYSRSSSIPYGALAYMPDSWEVNPDDWRCTLATDGFDRGYNELLKLWSFQCSLKNYDRTIQKFFKIIVPQIIETSLHIEYFYEESVRSTFYELKDGEVVESDREGIKYGYEDEDYKYW